MASSEERRRARSAWPIRSFRLGEEPLLDERDASTVDERLALVWALTCEQWQMSGLPLPQYARAQMPGTVVRRRA